MSANRVLPPSEKCSTVGLLRPPYRIANCQGMAPQGRGLRDRFLIRRKIRAVWQAADNLGGHSASAVKMLLATGHAVAEVAEIDLGRARTHQMETHLDADR